MLPAGQMVEAWTLTGRGGLVLEAITYGGIVTRLLAQDRNGSAGDVVLGFNDLDSYLGGHPYFGAITGRVAGRISGAAFTLNGNTYRLARNDPPNHLHGGPEGFDKCLWSAAPVDREDGAPSLRRSYHSPDGEEGYPGNVHVTVTYTVTNQNEFLIESEALSDRTTSLSLTHHSYFNLAGEQSGSIADHRLEIFASEFVPVDENLIATGRLEATSRHGNDFQTPRRIGDVIGQLYRGHGDLYALPKRNGNEMRLAARLEDPEGGRVMTVSTTQSYLQLYTGSHLNCSTKGKSGFVYARHAGVCLECEGYPDAASAARRNDILLHPGQMQRHATAYAFSVRSANAAGKDKSTRSASMNYLEGTSQR
ncbi:MAG TPA: aldose epimerase family protein [Terracidiphilus sp.]|nr:aldose epimerase family protein [Terracidiphilus sp.]